MHLVLTERVNALLRLISLQTCTKLTRLVIFYVENIGLMKRANIGLRIRINTLNMPELRATLLSNSNIP